MRRSYVEKRPTAFMSLLDQRRAFAKKAAATRWSKSAKG
jgi:hypothetical protein